MLREAVKKAITELYESKEIRSDLMVNLYTISAQLFHIRYTSWMKGYHVSGKCEMGF